MFKDKIAVITGAGSGIGRALAIQLAQEGARVALSDINRAGVDETLKLLSPGSGNGAKGDRGERSMRAKGYVLDVSSWNAFQNHADEVRRDFGSTHYLFNNAGAAVIGSVEHLTIEEYEWQLGINMWGVLYGTKAFLPMMLEQREGCIVNISSVLGLLAFPTQSAYIMSKFAVRGLTECLWSELDGTGVNAVCVHPGGIRTNIEKASRRCKAAGAEEEKAARMVEKMLRTPPEDCAADIINGLRKGNRRIITGYKSTTMFWMGRLFPNSYTALLKLVG